MLAKPTEGKTISVTTKAIRPAGKVFYHIPDTETFSGIVVEYKWFGPTRFGLTTKEPRFPVRVIDLNNVIDLQYDDGTKASKASTISMDKEVVVKGSKGDKYVVTINGNRATCTCKGFQFRGQCKHIEQVQNKA